MQEMPNVRPAYVLDRGAYDSPREETNRAHRITPSALPPMRPDLPKNRLGLAKWLTADDHPLTARVAVNRFWQNFFGRGIVGTPEDFGLQGSMPTHPKLLDWLARDFVNSGWDVKRLCRTIVLSKTYRQSSRCDKTLRQLDPENSLLARGPSRRLQAEMIRDMSLFVAGKLGTKNSGPPVSPYQPPNLWRGENLMTPAYRQSVGTDLYQRSLFSVWKRTAPLPNMLSFDATTREVCTIRRSATNTPLQALVLLNDVQFVEAARLTAEAASKAHPADTTEQFRFIFRRLTTRSPNERELEVIDQMYQEQLALFQQTPDDAKTILKLGSTPLSSKADAVSLATLTVVSQAILNSDAAIWYR